MIKKTLLFLPLIAFVFVGCNEVKTREYFIQNPKEAKNKYDECQKQTTMNDTEQRECENAYSALFYLKNTGGKSKEEILKEMDEIAKKSEEAMKKSMNAMKGKSN